MTSIKKAGQKSANKESGQSLLEIAISFPILLLLLLGTIDFGMAIYSYLILRDSVQEGALYGSLNPNNKVEIENRARNIFPAENDALSFRPVELQNPDLVEINITVNNDTCQGITNGETNNITVSATYNYPILVPFAGTILGSKTIPLDASATNAILQPACP
jgi:Flp pilus assembly protein TadG